MKGEVKWFDDEKGFGFIEYKSNGNVFVHYSSKHTKEIIEFELVKTNKGYIINK